jgi:hypothetical protein
MRLLSRRPGGWDLPDRYPVRWYVSTLLTGFIAVQVVVLGQRPLLWWQDILLSTVTWLAVIALSAGAAELAALGRRKRRSRED